MLHVTLPSVHHFPSQIRILKYTPSRCILLYTAFILNVPVKFKLADLNIRINLYSNDFVCHINGQVKRPLSFQSKKNYSQRSSTFSSKYIIWTNSALSMETYRYFISIANNFGGLEHPRKQHTEKWDEKKTYFLLTWSKRSRSCRSDSPTHLLRQSAPFLIKKATFLSPWLHSLARALATKVLPVPGGP